MTEVTPEEVDALLPQTQCGLCGYGGCMPYAEAIVYENASLNLCPPGGKITLEALGHLFDKNVSHLEVQTKPATKVFIRETECIGCTKCIQVCPVDAILGSAKNMHTVITDECTGCELCIPPCPVDCIDVIQNDTDPPLASASQYRARFYAREERLAKEKIARAQAGQEVSLKQKQNYIQAALKRAQAKKLQK